MNRHRRQYDLEDALLLAAVLASMGAFACWAVCLVRGIAWMAGAGK